LQLPASFLRTKALGAGRADEAIKELTETINWLAEKGEGKFLEEQAAAYCLRGNAYEVKQMMAQAQADYASALELALTYPWRARGLSE